MNNRAGWLALIVLAIASLLMIFVVMPRISQDGKPIGEQINAAGNAVKDAVTEGKAPEADAAKPQETAKADPQAPAAPAAGTASPATPSTSAPSTPAASADTPTFDVLRVEPDGSAVIAGRAIPNSTLEITSGSAVIAKVEVGPSGDFAAVLDNPLTAGDHQLVLKATGKDGKVVTSEEIATVSVPADKNGKLLAMVTKPGEASRLIALPQDAGKPAGDATTAPAAAAAPSQETASTAPAAPSSSNTATPAANAPAGTAGDVASAQASAPAAGSANPAVSAPALPITSGDLKITAVEIEGSKIFVAGMAKSGVRVRGAANGSVIGETRAGSNGHFVIDGNANLTVGDHRIAVEALGTAGQVLVRVEVPFNRPAGDQVAAVASPSPASPATPIDGGAFDNVRGEVAKAFSLLKGLYAAGKQPTLEAMAAARSATSIALQSLIEYRLPTGAPISASETVTATARDARTAREVLDALPRDVAAVGAALDNLTALIGKAVGPALAQQFGGAPAAMADGSGSRTIEQAPLTQSASNSVIIRRGDTLWQIARRAYGQGVRYTTIYLANEEQIANPDVIQPGQIFGVPSDFRPDSEELHRERMQHRRG